MLVMVGFALVLIVPLALLFLSATGVESGKAAVLQAKAAARTISSEAGVVYLQGNGATKTILVNYPDGVTGIRADGRLVAIGMKADERQLEITSPTFADMQWAPSSLAPGPHRLILTCMEGEGGQNYVEIREG